MSNLAQLDAIRYDSNGNGVADYASDWPSYFAAFTQATANMGCASICQGYELNADLDFDTDSSGGGQRRRHLLEWRRRLGSHRR